MGVTGEQHLWMSVITTAMKDAVMSRGILRDEALNFLTSNSRWFRQVCEMAGLEPEYIMDGMKKIDKPRRVK